MKKLDFFGSGPKIGRITLPYLALTIALTLFFPAVFKFGEETKNFVMLAGIVFLGLGLVLYAFTVQSLLKGIRETRLVTTGLYRYCQNPLYAVIMLLIIPGIGLLMNSWFVLTTPIVGYIIFKKCITHEYTEMTEVFGEEYKRYKDRTPEFFPFFK